MSKITTIHGKKQGRRPHYISEWCEKRGLSQADLAKKINADPSIVSRWFTGSTPSEVWQTVLGEYFGCGNDGIFRHPDDDWMAKFLRGRSAEEIERAKTLLKTAFPRKNGTED